MSKRKRDSVVQYNSTDDDDDDNDDEDNNINHLTKYYHTYFNIHYLI